MQFLPRIARLDVDCLGFSSGTSSAPRRAMTSEELRRRLRQFAIRVVLFVRTLPNTMDGQAIGRQLLRAALGVSANYRATGRARSRAEFIAKLGVVLEEADESEHWLDLLRACEIAKGPELNWLTDEAAQLRAIFRQALATARQNHHSRK